MISLGRFWVIAVSRQRNRVKVKPVGMNIPVDPPRFSENSRAGGGDIHTNSLDLKYTLFFGLCQFLGFALLPIFRPIYSTETNERLVRKQTNMIIFQFIAKLKNILACQTTEHALGKKLK